MSMPALRFFKRPYMVLVLASLVAAAIVLVSELAYWGSVGKLERVSEMTASQDSLQRLTQGVADAEAETRGFLLTGSPEYLARHERAQARVQRDLQEVEQRFGATPAVAPVLHKLREFTRSKLSELELTIGLVKDGKAQATSEILKSGIGQEKMQEIRQISAELLAQDERNIRLGREGIQRTLLLGRVAIIALSLCGLLALFMVQRQSAALERQQRQQQQLVQAERDRLEVQVRERTAQLTELTQHIQAAREDERHRLARNLHDDLGSLLTSAKLDAARLRSRIGGVPQAPELLAHLVGTLDSGIALGRRIVEDLRPSSLGTLGLVATLEILAREFAQSAGLKVSCALAPVQLAPASELIAYRLVQEAITNITKHAGATQVWISLEQQGGWVALTVRDDGRGFDPAARRVSAYGLVGMRYRVEASGGRLTIESAPGRTLIRATLPQSTDPPVQAAPADAPPSTI